MPECLSRLVVFLKCGYVSRAQYWISYILITLGVYITRRWLHDFVIAYVRFSLGGARSISPAILFLSNSSLLPTFPTPPQDTHVPNPPLSLLSPHFSIPSFSPGQPYISSRLNSLFSHSYLLNAQAWFPRYTADRDWSIYSNQFGKDVQNMLECS